jgi:truncated hemoglobin YjbI
MSPKELLNNQHQEEKTVLDKPKLFGTSHGYATRQNRLDYIDWFGIDAADVPESLDADGPSTPLYSWQLYSLLGPERIQQLIHRFYSRVFEDTEDEEFREAFVNIASKHHHIMTQTCFWIDAMGGGPAYHGGDYRLQFHHHHNARSVMNSRGAKRWMHHMRLALSEFKTDWDALDSRIIPCIILFLKIKIQKYSHQHKWAFDDSDYLLPYG